MMTTSQLQRRIGVFSIAMITAGSVDSIRNLPATALFGSSLIFFFVLAAIFFLLPCALVAAELSSTLDSEGGVFSWVDRAFGQTAGFLAVWFQWIENVIWYPTILSFVAGTLGYLLFPHWVDNKIFMVAVILIAFWSVTAINLFGIRASAWVANACAIMGLLIPMALIITLGVIWVLKGHPVHIHFNWSSLVPVHGGAGLWVSLTGIMMSFCGMEIAAVHTQDVVNPQRDYPRAMCLATIIILFTLMSGSLAIAIVLPAQKISLVAGIMQAFDAFFSAYHLGWLLPLIALMLILGGIGGVNNWIIAPTRGLQFALRLSKAPSILTESNRFGAPVLLLLLQAVIVTVISLVFLLMPSINGSYWLLTALAAQLYMLMYLMMFAAALVLRFKQSVERRSGFVIPGGTIGIILVCGAGLLAAMVTLVIGFIPPSAINVGSVQQYEAFLVVGLLLMTVIPCYLYRKFC